MLSAWWDFRHKNDGSMTCIVQTNHPKDKSDFIAEFAGSEGGVKQAERLIDDIVCGRADVMKMIRAALKGGNDAT